MQLAISTLVLALAARALSATTEINLLTESSNQDYNNKGLTGWHEGAGINALVLGPGFGQDLTYNDTDSMFTHQFDYPETGNSFSWFLGIYANTLDFGIVGDYKGLAVKDGYLAVNGSADGFYAAENLTTTEDIYGYSNHGAQIVVYFPEGSNKSGLPDAAVPIKLKVHVNGTQTSTTISFGAADINPTAAGSTSASPASASTSSSAASASSSAASPSVSPSASITSATLTTASKNAAYTGTVAVVLAAGAAVMFL